MEHQQDSSLFGINIDQAGRGHLSEAARWARFLAIVGFIMCGIIVLIGLSFGSIMGTLGDRYGTGYPDYSAPGLGAVMAVYYIAIALLYFFPCLFLYRFGAKMKQALAANNQEIVNTSFQNLKACFRFLGIVTIIILCFAILGFLVVVLGMATGAGM